MRHLLQEVLRKDGFTVVEAATGRDALIALERPIDAVLLDLDLPDMPGLDVLDSIQMLASPPPVIVLTGSVDRDAPACLDRGAHDFMLKPPRMPELVARVSAAVRVKRLQDQLSQQALTDALTGIANRRHGFQELERFVAGAERHHRELCVLMCDLDHFKTLNDTYGHEAGDECLREAARRLSLACRSSDLPIRWGGEEFVVLMPDASEGHAAEVAERIRSDVADPPFLIGGDEIHVTMSVGWAMRHEGENGPDLVSRADGALYEAKRRGRNAVVGA